MDIGYSMREERERLEDLISETALSLSAKYFQCWLMCHFLFRRFEFRSIDRVNTVFIFRFSPTYRVQIYGDPTDHDATLRVRHLPAGPEFTNVDTRSGYGNIDLCLQLIYSFEVVSLSQQFSRVPSMLDVRIDY